MPDPELPPCTAAVNLVDGLFDHLLDFTAREAVELAVTKSSEPISVEDPAKMVRVTCDLILKFDAEKSIAQRLKERVETYLNALYVQK